MSKIIPIKVILMLLILILIADGQESKENTLPNQSVKLTISVAEKICVGDDFTIVSRLENIGAQSSVINIRNIGQIRLENAFGSDAEYTIKGIRGSFSRLYDIRLKSGKVYEYRTVIDVK